MLCITGICNYWKRIARNNQINIYYFSPRTQKSNFRKRKMSIIFLPLVSTTYQCWESSSKGVIVVSKSMLLCLITSVRNAILYYYTCYNLGLSRMFYIVSITFHLLYPPCLDFVYGRVTAVDSVIFTDYLRMKPSFSI